MDSKIIAVDFDGTLCENKWPEIGEANKEMITYLKGRQANGDKLILWTCRVDDMLKNAIDWSAEQGLIFDAVNENLPEIVASFGTDTRKIFANEYIDDRNAWYENKTRSRGPLFKFLTKGKENVKLDDFRCGCMNERIDNRPNFIISGRQSGKTVSLIKEASKTNGVIVCPSQNMVDYVFQTACELGYGILKPITYDQLFMYPHRTNKNYHYFDEYGMTLIDALRRQLSMFDRHNTKSIIIDEESITSLNDILGGLKVRDMSGRELSFKIEVLGRNESDD